MKRNELKRTGLRPVSKKRLALRGKRDKVRDQVLERDQNACQAGILGLCTYHATDVHEILTRGRGGSIYDPDNCISLCRSCHTYITDNPKWAEENGFIIPSWAGFAEIVAAARARAEYGGGIKQWEEDDGEEA